MAANSATVVRLTKCHSICSVIGDRISRVYSVYGTSRLNFPGISRVEHRRWPTGTSQNSARRLHSRFSSSDNGNALLISAEASPSKPSPVGSQSIERCLNYGIKCSRNSVGHRSLIGHQADAKLSGVRIASSLGGTC